MTVHRVHAALHQVAICHVAIAVAVVLVVMRRLRLAGLLSLVVGLGGCGGGWALWTRDNGGWDDLSAAFKAPPSRAVVKTLAQHGPFIPLGVWLVLRGSR